MRSVEHSAADDAVVHEFGFRREIQNLAFVRGDQWLFFHDLNMPVMPPLPLTWVKGAAGFASGR